MPFSSYAFRDNRCSESHIILTDVQGIFPHFLLFIRCGKKKSGTINVHKTCCSDCEFRYVIQVFRFSQSVLLTWWYFLFTPSGIGLRLFRRFEENYYLHFQDFSLMFQWTLNSSEINSVTLTMEAVLSFEASEQIYLTQCKNTKILLLDTSFRIPVQCLPSCPSYSFPYSYVQPTSISLF